MPGKRASRAKKPQDAATIGIWSPLASRHTRPSTARQPGGGISVGVAACRPSAGSSASRARRGPRTSGRSCSAWGARSGGPSSSSGGGGAPVVAARRAADVPSLGLHVILVLTATAVAAPAAAVIAAELLLERLAAGLGRVLDDVAHPRRGLVDRVARGLDGAADAEAGHTRALRRLARRARHRARDPAGAVDRSLGDVGEAVLHVLAQAAHR